MANLVNLVVPDIGDSSNVNIAEVYIKVGDTVQIDDNLIMLETDKATMEVPADKSGVIKELKIKPGMKVSEGDVIAVIEVEGVATQGVATQGVETQGVETPDAAAKVEAPKVAVNPDSTKAPKEHAQTLDEANFAQVDFDKVFASPSIRKLARELGVNLTNLSGTGSEGRITEDDLKGYVKQALSSNNQGGAALGLIPWPQVDFAKYGEIKVVELSRIKKLSGANLLRNWVMIPHVTQFDQADITDMEEFRKQLNDEFKSANIKITPLAFLIKAATYALKTFPEFNASLDGDNLIYKEYYNIGFAADTPSGLVVPVLKGADKMGISEIAIKTGELAKLAREGKLKPSDMQGGTFTISSLGGIGGTAFTPIINAPEVAILGVSKAAMAPVFNGKDFTPKLMLPLSLSYDHRIIDGAKAAKFTSYLSKLLSDIRRLVV